MSDRCLRDVPEGHYLSVCEQKLHFNSSQRGAEYRQRWQKIVADVSSGARSMKFTYFVCVYKKMLIMYVVLIIKIMVALMLATLLYVLKGHWPDDTYISLRIPALARLRVQPVPIQRVAPR